MQHWCYSWNLNFLHHYWFHGYPTVPLSRCALTLLYTTSWLPFFIFFGLKSHFLVSAHPKFLTSNDDVVCTRSYDKYCISGISLSNNFLCRPWSYSATLLFSTMVLFTSKETVRSTSPSHISPYISIIELAWQLRKILLRLINAIRLITQFCMHGD